MRRLTFILILALAALALAACGGGSGDSSDGGGGGDDAAVSTGGDSAGSVLASAATNAAGAGSSKVAFTITTQIPQQEGPVTLTGEGAFDYEAKTGELTYDFGELLGSLGTGAAEEPVEMILDGNVFYMKFALLSNLIPGGKPWIRFDLEALAGQEGIDLSQLQSVNQGDPSQTLEYLRAIGSVEEVGTEEVRGVETTHYTGVIDLQKAVELAPEETRAQVQQSIDQLKEQSGLTELPVEVWIDGDGLPARIQYSFDGSIVAEGTESEEFTTIFSMELFDWGTEVTVEPPPASEVTDISELTQLGVATTG